MFNRSKKTQSAVLPVVETVLNQDGSTTTTTTQTSLDGSETSIVTETVPSPDVATIHNPESSFLQRQWAAGRLVASKAVPSKKLLKTAGKVAGYGVGGVTVGAALTFAVKRFGPAPLVAAVLLGGFLMEQAGRRRHRAVLEAVQAQADKVGARVDVVEDTLAVIVDLPEGADENATLAAAAEAELAGGPSVVSLKPKK